MSQELLITITTRDGASQTFRSIGTSATAMGNAIKSAGAGAGGSLDKVSSSSAKAASGMDRASSSASKTASSLTKAGSSAASFSAKGAAAGAAISSLVSALGEAGRAAAEEEAGFARLQAAIEATGDSYDKYADQIDKAQQAAMDLSFADDEAVNALGTLTTTTGDAQEALDLLGVSMDLARGKGIDLATASTIVGKVAAGNIGILQRYGIVVEEGATAQEALAAIQSRFAGQADAYANTTAGAMDRVRVAMENNVEAAGAWVNAHGQLITLLPGLTSGFTLAGAAIGGFAPKMKAAVSALQAPQQAFTSLAGAINPLGLAITAAAVAGGILVHSLMEQSQSAADAQASYTNLATAIDQVADAGARADLRNATLFQSSETQGAEGFLRNLGATVAGTSRNFDEYTISGQEAAEANNLVADTALKAGDSVGNFASEALDMREAVDAGSLTGDQLIATLDGLNKAFSYTGNGASEVQAETMRIVDAWRAGDISAEAMVAGIEHITRNVGAYADALTPATEATKELTDAQQAAARQDVIDGLEGQSARYEALAESIAKANAAAREPALASGMGFGLGFDEEARADVEAYGEELAAAREKATETANALRGQLVPALDGASSGFAALAHPGEDTLDVLDRLAPTVDNVGGHLLQLADGLNDAAQGMQGILGVFSAIDQLGGASGQAAGIAEQLVGDPGVWSEIDDLVSNAAISQTEYNDAVQAGYGIQAKNAEIEESLNSIRAQQLPLLDSQMASYRAYIDRLAEASTEEQQHALYLMDSANQAKVAASYSTAYAASLGEIPTDVATEIIADGAQADPILADILEQFGLIEVGADGTISVNFPDKATLDDVTAAIDNLTETSIEIAIATSGAEEADRIIASTRDNLDDMDGRQATAEVAVTETGEGAKNVKTALDDIDGAHAVADVSIAGADTQELVQVNASLDEIDGRTATATVDIVYDDSVQARASEIADSYGDTKATQTVTVKVEADTSAVDSALASIETDKTVEVKIDADTAPFDATLAGIESDKTITIDVEADTSGFDSAWAAITGSSGGGAAGRPRITLDITANDTASPTISDIKRAADTISGGSYAVRVTADDAASNIIKNIGDVAGDVAKGTYTATLDATDNASSTIGDVKSAADTFATGTYNASILATDNASSTISTPQGAADTFASGAYNASIDATDNASGVISGPQDAATAFATTYSATLTAVDNASATIASVSAQLDALDGRTVTTYVTTQEVASLPAKKLGGAIIPGAKLGRAVQVGEDGPETVTLPYGSMVTPSPASQNAPTQTATPDTGKADQAAERAARREERATERIEKSLKRRSKAYDQWIDAVQDADDAIRDLESASDYGGNFDTTFESLMPHVDLKKAYKLGADSAEAFYDGLLGVAEDRVSDQSGEIENTIYPSKEAADAALADLQRFTTQRDKLANKKVQGREFDKDVERAERQAEKHLERLEARSATTSERVGSNISTGVSVGTDDATTAINTVSDQLNALDKVASVPEINVDASDATIGFGMVNTGLNNLDGRAATVAVKVNREAWDALKADIDAAQLGVTVVVKTKDKSAEEGDKLGGSVLADEVPHAAMGRVIQVGEAGPEAVLLPFGSQVVPSPASASVIGSQPRPAINIYAPVHIYPATPDIAAAIYGQLTGVAR